MQLGSQIKKYRNDMNLSQDELAEKIYVTRQTISNWENEKNYPDIHSLLLLSLLFNISLDQLIKGDIKVMKENIKIQETEQKKFNNYANIFSILFIVTLISFVPLLYFLKIYGIFIWIALFTVTLIFAFKVEKVKKNSDIYTYKEIIAFTEGRHLDEITAQSEKAKRPYQRFLLMLGSGAVTFIVCLLLYLLLKL